MSLGLGLGPVQVQVQPAIGLEGDFASANPRHNVLAGAGAIVAGPGGLTIGRFCWYSNNGNTDDLGVPAAAVNFGSGNVLGLVHRSQTALITAYLADASMVIPAGFPAGAIFSAGDFLVKNVGTGQAQPGMKAYANFADGTVTFAATGAATGAGSGSSSAITAQTNSFTGSIANNILTVASAGITGTIYPGTTLSGTNVATGTKILSQLSGAAGGAGTYAVSPSEQTVASTSISGTYGLLTVGGTVVSGFAIGSTLSGTNVVAGTTIRALGTGTGGAGTYIVDNNTGVTTTAISVAAQNVETKWYAMSYGLTGELVKISSVQNN